MARFFHHIISASREKRICRVEGHAMATPKKKALTCIFLYRMEIENRKTLLLLLGAPGDAFLRTLCSEPTKKNASINFPFAKNFRISTVHLSGHQLFLYTA